MSSLFQKRKDCVFVISTHDIFLPIDQPEASVLLLRSCEWNGKNISNWDADLISEVDQIPNSIKHEILGSKRDILFVEGTYESLDRQIYQLIYPNVTIMPQGNCTQVEKAVEGIKGTEGLHWINAYGLVDADDRTEEQIQNLIQKGVAALNSYSVESLYYNLGIVKKIAEKISGVTGEDANIIFERAISNIINDLTLHKARLCAKLCEKQIRNGIMVKLPNHKEIRGKQYFNLDYNVQETLEKEEAYFDKLVDEKKLDNLISRYPIRETPVLTNIVRGLDMLPRAKYEAAVRKLIIDDNETKEYFKTLLNPLTTLMEQSLLQKTKGT